MKLPGPPKLWLNVGILIALVGVVVGGYAYTGDRAYEIEFVAVAFLGFLLLVLGSWMAGWAQAQRPRLGAARERDDDEDNEERGKPSLTERLKAALPGRSGTGTAMQAQVACPSCRAVFETEGSPPFQATCPECGHEDRVERPQPAG